MKRTLLMLLLSNFSLILCGLSVPCLAQTPPSTTQKHNPLAQAHRDKGDTLISSQDYPAALREYQAAYALDKDKPNSARDTAIDLFEIGFISARMSHYDKAINSYMKAVPIFQKIHEINAEAAALFAVGNDWYRLGHSDKAIGAFQKALPFYRQAQDFSGEADDLNNLVVAYEALPRYDKVIECYQQMLAIHRQTKDLHAQANDLNQLGVAYLHLNQYDKVIQYFQQAVPVYQESQDQAGLAEELFNLGLAYEHLSQHKKAIEFYQQACSAFQQIGDQADRATALLNLGTVYEHLNQHDKAIDAYQQAMTIDQQIKDLKGQVDVLNDLGIVYHQTSQDDKVIETYGQALLIHMQIGDQNGLANDLMDLGNAYDNLGHYDKAMDTYREALTIHRQSKNQTGEAGDLNNLGNTCDDLGQYEKAIAFYAQALRLYRKIGDQDGQAGDMTNLGISCIRLGQDDKAIDYLKQALVLHQRVNAPQGRASDLSNLGAAYDDLGHSKTAIAFYQRALSIDKQVKDQRGQANALGNLGNAYEHRGQYDKATQYYHQGLTLQQQNKDLSGEAAELANLMHVWQDQKQASLAIFYGKQAVNVYQSIRQNIQTMDKTIQKTYLQSKEPTYRELAELLIQQGRLPEAEQVLGLLKDEELKDFVQRDATQIPVTQRTLPYDPTEEAQKEAYATLADHVTAIGEQIEEINRKTPLTLDDAKQLTTLQEQLAPARAKFQAFLTDLPKELPKPKSNSPDPGQMLLDQSLQSQFQKTLFDLGPGTVAIYTIVESDKVRIVMMTSQTQVAREYPIKDTDLRAKVLAFRENLKDPTLDPRPQAHELYQILIGPIEKDLAGAKATTLMWSLDDDLRYIPIAALYDGKQYLVERYRTTEFTGANLPRLDAAPPAQYSVLGLGVSQAHPGYPALPGVPQELNGIIKESNGGGGVMDGTILLDRQLTWDALKIDLNLRYPIVHIASHFALGADYAHSFLLLGDGPHSLDELSTQSQIFQSADLLTLSACETAVGNTSGDGHEIESFGSLAQDKGAQSIIASLWPVADASTPLLMEGFYRQLSHGDVSKAEALRQAQLSLLHGTVSGPGSPADRAQIVPGKSDKSVAAAHPFTPDPEAPFAHPYYWAPFILIGNWK